jgi:hypothetical protein
MKRDIEFIIVKKKGQTKRFDHLRTHSPRIESAFLLDLARNSTCEVKIE